MWPQRKQTSQAPQCRNHVPQNAQSITVSKYIHRRFKGKALGGLPFGFSPFG